MFFRLGLFLIPFENLFFAPSAGWAAIAPICFFVYVLLNFRAAIKKINKEIVLGLLGIFIVSFFAYIYYYIEFGNLLKNIFTIVLGISFYLSLKIRYLNRGKKKLLKDIDLIFYSYLISLITGIIQYLSYKFHINFIIKIIDVLSKRMYYPRVQFTFAEPSFISCHLYGVLLVVILFCKINNVNIHRRNYSIFYLWVVLGNILAESSRLALDTVVVFTIYFFYYKIFKNKKQTKYIYVTLICLSFIFISNSKNFIKNYNPRLYSIINKGIYADASFASRYFRINASIKGYKNNIKAFIFGYGIGNLYIPLDLGYQEAKKEYNNEYITEVETLKESKPTSLFSMPIKIISEFGVFIFILVLMLLFSKKYLDIYLIILYIYTQFDSYAFYTVWIYIFFREYLKNKNMNGYRYKIIKKDYEENDEENKYSITNL